MGMGKDPHEFPDPDRVANGNPTFGIDKRSPVKKNIITDGQELPEVEPYIPLSDEVVPAAGEQPLC
jgi:hypothetical protein